MTDIVPHFHGPTSTARARRKRDCESSCPIAGVPRGREGTRWEVEDRGPGVDQRREYAFRGTNVQVGARFSPGLGCAVNRRRSPTLVRIITRHDQNRPLSCGNAVRGPMVPPPHRNGSPDRRVGASLALPEPGEGPELGRCPISGRCQGKPGSEAVTIVDQPCTGGSAFLVPAAVCDGSPRPWETTLTGRPRTGASGPMGPADGTTRRQGQRNTTPRRALG